MRAVLWVLALFAAAVGLTLAARYDSGYVLLVLNPWRVELSLNLLVLILGASFVAGYVFVRFILGAVGLPAIEARVGIRFQQGRVK